MKNNLFLLLTLILEFLVELSKLGFTVRLTPVN